MIVCLCHRVSDRDIVAAVQAGTGCFEVLQDELRVAASCGACGDCAREVFETACRRGGPPAEAAAVVEVTALRA